MYSRVVCSVIMFVSDLSEILKGYCMILCWRCQAPVWDWWCHGFASRPRPPFVLGSIYWPPLQPNLGQSCYSPNHQGCVMSFQGCQWRKKSILGERMLVFIATSARCGEECHPTTVYLMAIIHSSTVTVFRAIYSEFAVPIFNIMCTSGLLSSDIIFTNLE